MQQGTSDFLQRANFCNEQLLQRVTSNFCNEQRVILQRATSEFQRVTSNKWKVTPHVNDYFVPWLVCLSIEHVNNYFFWLFFFLFFHFLLILDKLLKGTLKGLRQFLITESLLKMMKNAFLFHLKSSFRSQDIWVFVMTFWSFRKNGSIRKIRLISKPMTSQPG